MRNAFIRTLLKEAKKNDRIMLLTADLGYTVFEQFRETLPKQFINVGVAESNMMGIATGLALSGKTVFVYTIASFATTRPYEQIRLDISAHKVPVIIVGVGSGLSYSDAGVTHQGVVDIALMRTIPGMTIICPVDAESTVWATNQAITLGKPMYLRLGKYGEPVIYTKLRKLTVGRGNVIQHGKHVALIATGTMVFNAIEAAKILKKKGIAPTVIDMHTVKPLDDLLILKLAKTHKLLVTIEDHSIIGGLGGAVSETLSAAETQIRHIRIGLPDMFIYTIGSLPYVRNQLKLNPFHIAKTIHNAYRLKEFSRKVLS